MMALALKRIPLTTLVTFGDLQSQEPTTLYAVLRLRNGEIVLRDIESGQVWDRGLVDMMPAPVEGELVREPSAELLRSITDDGDEQDTTAWGLAEVVALQLGPGPVGNFRDYDAPFPAVLQALGFQDHSYHNDVAARAAKDVGEGKVLLVWCAEEDPAEREENASRYTAYVVEGRGEVYGTEPVGDILHAETEAELVDVVQRLGGGTTK